MVKASLYYNWWNNSCTTLYIAYFTLLIGFHICTYNCCLYTFINTFKLHLHQIFHAFLIYYQTPKPFILEKNLTNQNVWHIFSCIICALIFCFGHSLPFIYNGWPYLSTSLKKSLWHICVSRIEHSAVIIFPSMIIYSITLKRNLQMIIPYISFIIIKKVWKHKKIPNYKHVLTFVNQIMLHIHLYSLHSSFRVKVFFKIWKTDLQLKW